MARESILECERGTAGAASEWPFFQMDATLMLLEIAPFSELLAAFFTFEWPTWVYYLVSIVRPCA